ncbi:unnamed protein product [Arabidopsis halleri]
MKNVVIIGNMNHIELIHFSKSSLITLHSKKKKRTYKINSHLFL